MFRTNHLMLFFALVTVIQIGSKLKADEPIQDAKSEREETSISFERLQFTVSRHKGKILFDGFEAPRGILENKSKEVRLIETFDGLQFASDTTFIQWAHKLKGTRTYTYDQVTRVSADGSKITQPLVFFDKETRTELDVKWHAWLEMRQAEIEAANRSRLAQEEKAKRYQQQSQFNELQAQLLRAQAAAAEESSTLSRS